LWEMEENIMQKIQNNNWNPKETCQERFCDNKLEFFECVEVNGLEILIGLCNKHKEVWEENEEV